MIMLIKTVADLDPWLEPYRPALEHQQKYVADKSSQILSKKSLEEFSVGYLYFGLHQTPKGWVLREWAPNATQIFLICELNNWADDQEFAFSRLENGVWELELPKKALKHEDLYKLNIHWEGGSGERLPSYANYVVQDPESHIFSACVWAPKKVFIWSDSNFEPADETLLVYEAHIGMSGDREAVTSYGQFTKETLPRIKELGYNTIQLMAVQEHPYYGSFGYHVSNFFAASSRFGTPNDLKELVNEAHRLGLRVVLDIVHSHAVKNENEGLSRFDGTTDQYFHSGSRGDHDAWDSRVFDYGKPEVVHFLLSNVRYWLDEFHFDGYRFDGVTSMLYMNHGLGQDYTSYDDYFGANIDLDALTYLNMATKLAHSLKPSSILIAEDMSAFPGLAAPTADGGVGFDYRLSMGMPDFWIKTLKEKRDEDWDLNHLFHELTTHRPEEKTISYAESHDQALVGDKTLIFRLIDKDMYDFMSKSNSNLVVERGMALHKIIRLLTASTNAGGYLNFMGNEFGHPEWIDFPREGNGWSYKYARRQWSLVDNKELKYSELNNFDIAMVEVAKKLKANQYHWVEVDQGRKLLSYIRDNYLFVFNLSPNTSYTDYEIAAFNGKYKLVLSSDDAEFGGQDRVSAKAPYEAKGDKIKLYIPSRTALVFELL